MKKRIKRIIKFISIILMMPILYLLISFLFTWITLEDSSNNCKKDHLIYLSTNGVHLDIIIPYKHLSDSLKDGLNVQSIDQFIAFGWGDANFYLNTQTWDDLRFTTAFEALFLKSETLIHVTKYRYRYNYWRKIPICGHQLSEINRYINISFHTDKKGQKKELKNKGYGSNDNFYEAVGSYSCFHTCNTWVNAGFKECGLMSCLWTPFDFGLLDKYEP